MNKEKKLRKALEDFALTFAAQEGTGKDKYYWGHDTDLGDCKEEFDLAVEQITKIFKSSKSTTN